MLASIASKYLTGSTAEALYSNFTELKLTPASSLKIWLMGY